MSEMEVFLCSAFKNRELNEKIIEVLENLGHKVYYAERDTLQEDIFEIYSANTKGIENCDVFLAVTGNHYGKDWTYEVGLAVGLGKKIICFGKPLEEDKMCFGAIVDKATQVNSIDELVKII